MLPMITSTPYMAEMRPLLRQRGMLKRLKLVTNRNGRKKTDGSCITGAKDNYHLLKKEGKQCI